MVPNCVGQDNAFLTESTGYWVGVGGQHSWEQGESSYSGVGRRAEDNAEEDDDNDNDKWMHRA